MVREARLSWASMICGVIRVLFVDNVRGVRTVNVGTIYTCEEAVGGSKDAARCGWAMRKKQTEQGANGKEGRRAQIAKTGET